jgi:hypothetical protein
MGNQERQIVSVGLCLRKIKEFLDSPTDKDKQEKARTAHEHLELLFNIGSDYVRNIGCGKNEKLD